MVTSDYKGRGRRATLSRPKPPGNWLFRVFMRWFSRGGLRP